MNEWALIALVMISEGLLHYFPWKKLLKGNELPRIPAYVLGILGLMVPYSLWLLEQGKEVVVLMALEMLWRAIFAGGLSVLALYGLDRHIELEWSHMESKERQASESEHGKKS